MTTVEIITKAGRPIEGLGPWRHSEYGRAARITRALTSHERITPWSYIVFDGWSKAQASILAKAINSYYIFRNWKVCNHPKKGIILYYEPTGLSQPGPAQFEIPAPRYHYPFNKCDLAGNWFKVRGPNVHALITQANRPDRLFQYDLNPAHGHIIFRSL